VKPGTIYKDAEGKTWLAIEAGANTVEPGGFDFAVLLDDDGGTRRLYRVWKVSYKMAAEVLHVPD
jgi:hypothetical protein